MYFRVFFSPRKYGIQSQGTHLNPAVKFFALIVVDRSVFLLYTI